MWPGRHLITRAACVAGLLFAHTGASRLPGLRAIVVGGGGGIGRAIAAGLATEGCHITIVGRRAGVLAEVAGSIPNCTAHAADATCEEDVRALFKTVGRVDILVNTAGVAPAPIAPTEMSAKEMLHVLNVNVVAPAICSREALKSMTPGGRIINVASIAALAPRPGNSTLHVDVTIPPCTTALFEALTSDHPRKCPQVRPTMRRARLHFWR